MSRPSKKNKGRKPTVDELVAARNPLKRLAVKPVDPYQVQPPVGEEAQGREARVGEAATPAEPEIAATRTPETPTSGAEQVSAGVADDVVVPYSTHIRRSLIRGIKLRAFTSDRKDREIVEAALEEYFENHPAKPVE
jgi:hypothetical protein